MTTARLIVHTFAALEKVTDPRPPGRLCHTANGQSVSHSSQHSVRYEHNLTDLPSCSRLCCISVAKIRRSMS